MSEYKLSDDLFDFKFIKLKNVFVYDLTESMKASTYPYAYNLNSNINYKTVDTLANAEKGSGHDNFLSGIIVNFDMLASHYFLIQFQRYHFAQIVSSMSKMHRILDIYCDSEYYNQYVDPRIKDVIAELVEAYNNCSDKTKKDQKFMQILANIPCGFRLWMRVSTNLLQLKNMYLQRKNHRTNDWKEFCEFISSLPALCRVLKTDKGDKHE